MRIRFSPSFRVIGAYFAVLLALPAYAGFNSANVSELGDAMPYIGTYERPPNGNTNDNAENVLGLIGYYNLNGVPIPNPLLTDTIYRLGDGDTSDLSIGTYTSAGIQLFSDPNGPATNDPNSINGSPPAYFAYTPNGVSNLLYYSVKAADGFSLFRFDANLPEGDFAGLNNDGVKGYKLNRTPINTQSQDISHVTFWMDNSVAAVPEPASMAVWGTLLGVSSICGYRRRKRQRLDV